MTRALLLLASLIPGTSAILLGRALFGSLLMVVGLFAWNAIPLGFWLWSGPEAPWIGWTGVVFGPASSLLSFGWTAVATSKRRHSRLCESADRAHRLAMLAYLRGDLVRAERVIRTGLGCDPQDADLLFVAWNVARAQGHGGRARRLLARLRQMDEDDKWASAVQQQLG